MDLDTMKEKWAEQDRKLELSLQWSRGLMMERGAQRARARTRRIAITGGAAALVWLAACLALGEFEYAHWPVARFVAPAAAIHLWLIVALSASIRQVALALRIDYSAPVASMQRQAEEMRASRMQSLKWMIATGQLVGWIPLLIVVLQAAWNLDAYRFLDGTFLAVNLAFGAAMIPVTLWLLAKLGGRIEGRDMDVASRLLAELAAFEQEPPEE